MGLSPDDLAGLTLYDFDLKCEGFKRKMQVEESLFRKVAWFSMAPHLGKNSKGIDYFWPMDSDKSNSGELFTKKQIEANLNAYRIFKKAELEKLNLN
jgi:hypothetical protein